MRFPTGPHSPASAELERDLGIALTRVLSQSRTAASRESTGRLAKENLQRSLRSWRGDADAWLSLGLTLHGGGEGKDASQAAANALKLEPDSVAALGVAAELALAAGRFSEAERLATRLIALSPNDVEPLATRALALGGRGDWKQAEHDCLTALTIHPLHPRSRLAFAVCRHHLGDVEGGRREAATASQFYTDSRQRELALEWFRSQTR